MFEAVHAEVHTPGMLQEYGALHMKKNSIQWGLKNGQLT